MEQDQVKAVVSVLKADLDIAKRKLTDANAALLVARNEIETARGEASRVTMEGKEKDIRISQLNADLTFAERKLARMDQELASFASTQVCLF